jgi:hypothetical protein
MDSKAVYANLHNSLLGLDCRPEDERPKPRVYVPPPPAAEPKPEPRPEPRQQPQPRRTEPAPDYLPRWSFGRRMASEREKALWEDEFDISG